MHMAPPEGESPKHEMRGAWVATVYGIDWPSTTGTTAACAEEQRKELRRILDILQEGGLNAVMLQVRSMSDAMYRSALNRGAHILRVSVALLRQKAGIRWRLL